MPGPALTFPMQLDPTVRRELEAFLAQLNEGFLYVEHNEDGTHGDITARSIVISGTEVGDATFSGPLEIAQWLDITPIDTASDHAQNSANNKGWTQPRILLGLVRGPNINPATDVGIRLRGTALSDTIQPDFTISAGYDPFDALTALVVTHMDTSQSAAAVNIPLKIGFNASLTSKFNIMPDQRTESVDGVSLGAVDFGFGSNFHGFTNILGRTLYALNAAIIGSPTTSGVRLEVDTISYPGALAVREGDDSDWNDVMCRRLVSQSGFVESTSGDYYLGQGIPGDILLRKNSAGGMQVRLGDNSNYGDVYCRGLVLTTGMTVPTLTVTTVNATTVNATTVNATSVVATSIVFTPNVTVQGNDPLIDWYEVDAAADTHRWRQLSYFGEWLLLAYNDAFTAEQCRYTFARNGTLTAVALTASTTVSGANVVASGTVAGSSVAATGTVSGATVTATGTVTGANVTATSTVSGVAVLASSVAVVAGTTIANAGGSVGYSVLLASGAFGTGAVGGSYVQIGANTSGSGAAGTLILQRRGGTVDAIWSDNSGLLRTNTGSPNESGAFGFSDTSGTVVGDQTSSRAFKDIIAERTDYETALGVILDTPVYDFRYKDARYNNELFTGITTDDSPIFGKDGGKSFNEITACGMLILAMKGQQEQIEDLKRDVEELKAVIRKWA